MDILRAYIVVRRHDQMRQHRLRLDSRYLVQRNEFVSDAVRPEPVQQIELCTTRLLGAVIGQVHDHALLRAVDRAMRLIDEAGEPFGEPVVTPRVAALAVHALLHHDPLAVIGDNEAVEIEIETVLNRGAVDLGDEPARLREGSAVDAGALADGDQLLRRLARMLAAPPAHMNAKLGAQRSEPALERAEHAGGDAGRVPVHPHHGAERLEPERMRKAPQEILAPVVMYDRLRDHRAEPRHARSQPWRHTAAMKRQVGASAASGHRIQLLSSLLLSATGIALTSSGLLR